jgi:hypothetical protein
MKPVELVEPGDVVVLPRGGRHHVLRVEHYPDGAHVVVYASHEEASYENRARDKSGFNITQTRYAIEKSLRPLRTGEFVVVAR